MIVKTKHLLLSSCFNIVHFPVCTKVKFKIDHLPDFYFGHKELRPSVKKLILTIMIIEPFI